MSQRRKTTIENLSSLEEYVTDNDCEEDIHVCKKCKLVFTDLQEYLKHKVKHDNCKVTYRRTGSNKRMIVPKLVQKNKDLTIQLEPVEENAVVPKKRGRKKKSEVASEEIQASNIIEDKPSYYCPKCDQKFNREATLRRHTQYVHETENDEEEDVDDAEKEIISLGRVMAQEEGVDEEEDYHPDPTEREDEENDPDYRRKTNSNVPINKADAADRPYNCDICFSRFKEANVLKTHMLTHTNQRLYQCEVCPLAFKTKGSLKRHLRRHTGERPYTCELCGRAFAEAGALTRHMKSRVSCLHKTDNDLPRYGKRWAFTAVTNDPSTERGVKEGQQVTIQLADVRPGISGQETVAIAQDEQAHNIEDGVVPEVVINMEVIDMSGQDGVTSDMTTLEQIIELTTQNQPLPLEELTITHCQVCRENMGTIPDLRIHLSTHLADMHIKCSMCHFLTKDKTEFNQHMADTHQSNIRALEGLELMQSEETRGETLTEDQQSSDAKLAIKQLMDLPTFETDPIPDDSPQIIPKGGSKCPVCKKVFRGNANLRQHMRFHTGDRPYKCPTCDRCFITKDALNKHSFIHVDERQYKCGECGKLFKRISHVREHLKIHNNDRPYPCVACEKSFKSLNAWKVHQRTHVDLLPYVCKYCHRRFREKGSLVRHIRMHTGERPFSCPYCKKTFSEHGTLNRHLKAKVPCSKEIQMDNNIHETEEVQYEIAEEPVTESSKVENDGSQSTVLAEFSSVVADTQQYLETEAEDSASIVQHVTDDGQTEFVVLETDVQGDNTGIQNIEIITDGNFDSNLLESLQVTEDYIVITDQNEDMKIYDSKTGETIATMPLSSLSEGDNQFINISTDTEGQVVNMDQNEIEAIAMQPIELQTLQYSDTVETIEEEVTMTTDNTEVTMDTDSTEQSQSLVQQAMLAASVIDE